MSDDTPDKRVNVTQLSDEELKIVTGGAGEPGSGHIKINCLICGWTSGWGSPNDVRKLYLDHRMNNPNCIRYQVIDADNIPGG